MKFIYIFLALITSAQAKAYWYPTHPQMEYQMLYPGQSVVVQNPYTMAALRVACSGGYAPIPVPQPPLESACTIKYSAVHDENCKTYRVYNTLGAPKSACYETLPGAIQMFDHLLQSGACIRNQQPATCEIRYSTPTDVSCSGARIYINNEKVSECFSSPDTASLQMEQLKRHGLCL